MSEPFRPHPLLPGGHLQTLGAYFFKGRLPAYRATQHIVELPDGDRIVLHDDCPPTWKAGDRAAVMMHGLAGCHASPYMVRIADKLNARGVRTFRMDLRGAGAGAALARLHYHSGRSEDAAAAIESVSQLCPGSPVALVGFSLGGNVALKLVGESAGATPPALDRCMSVSPPIDLAACSRALSIGFNRHYDRYFVKLLTRSIGNRRRLVPDLAYVELDPPAKSMWDFDDRFTAPLAGYRDAEDYYGQCNSRQFLARIEIPTLILAARNDPMIPFEPFENTAISAATRLELTTSGGHLGFAAAGPLRRWMDQRVVDWVAAK